MTRLLARRFAGLRTPGPRGADHDPYPWNLKRHADGVLSGIFRTLTIRAQIELRPLPPADGVRSYDVVAGPDFRPGTGSQAQDDVLAPIHLVLRAAELPRTIHAEAVRTQGDGWTIYWRDG